MCTCVDFGGNAAGISPRCEALPLFLSLFLSRPHESVPGPLLLWSCVTSVCSPVLKVEPLPLVTSRSVSSAKPFILHVELVHWMSPLGGHERLHLHTAEAMSAPPPGCSPSRRHVSSPSESEFPNSSALSLTLHASLGLYRPDRNVECRSTRPPSNCPPLHPPVWQVCALTCGWPQHLTTPSHLAHVCCLWVLEPVTVRLLGPFGGRSVAFA